VEIAMINIHQKALQDLEFQTVLQQVSDHCVTALGKAKALKNKRAVSCHRTELVNIKKNQF